MSGFGSWEVDPLDAHGEGGARVNLAGAIVVVVLTVTDHD